MIIADDILNPILQKRPNLPKDCPQIHGKREFAQRHDTTGGYCETPDYTGVTCRPFHFASNSEYVHPACESCKVAGTIIMDMKEYRKKLGLRN